MFSMIESAFSEASGACVWVLDRRVVSSQHRLAD